MKGKINKVDLKKKIFIGEIIFKIKNLVVGFNSRWDDIGEILKIGREVSRNCLE